MLLRRWTGSVTMPKPLCFPLPGALREHKAMPQMSSPPFHWPPYILVIVRTADFRYHLLPVSQPDGQSLSQASSFPPASCPGIGSTYEVKFQESCPTFLSSLGSTMLAIRETYFVCPFTFLLDLFEDKFIA